GARHDLLESLRERAARAEAEQELRAEQARLGERQRIAREMHDVLAHKVSLIALHAGALEVNPAAGAEQVRATAQLIRGTPRHAPPRRGRGPGRAPGAGGRPRRDGDRRRDERGRLAPGRIAAPRRAGSVTRVLLVDDEALVRAGLRMILESADDLQVVGEAGDGRAAIDAVNRYRPNVVLMDIRMPRLDGLAATAALRARERPPSVVVLTTFHT